MASELDSYLKVNLPPDSYWELDCKLHLIMAEYAESPSLHRVLENINLFRLLQKARDRFVLDHTKLPEDWHRRLVVAIRNGDADEAERAMR